MLTPTLLPRLLGLTLRTLYQPIEIYSRYQQLMNFSSNSMRSLPNCAYGDHPQQQLDLYLPTPSTTNPNLLPVVIYAHGGNWVAGDKSQYRSICKQIAAQGFIVANINYRLAPNFTYAQQVQDINQAVLWLCRNLNQFQGDQQRIFLMGDTAGANLLCSYALALNHPYLRNALEIQQPISRQQVKGLLLLYGIFDFEYGLFNQLPFLKVWHEALLGNRHNDQKETVLLASPIRHLHKYLPPVFLAAAECDPLFSQSIALAQRLKSLKHTYTTAFYDKSDYPSGNHLWFAWQKQLCAQKMLEDALLFLKLQRYHLQLASTDSSTIQTQAHHAPEVAPRATRHILN
jgi:acetyl esterase/lipase